MVRPDDTALPYTSSQTLIIWVLIGLTAGVNFSQKG
jgi:hypothetical protein